MRLFIMFVCCAIISYAMFFSVNKNLTEIDKATEEYRQKLGAEKKQEVGFENWRKTSPNEEVVMLIDSCKKTIAIKEKEKEKIKNPKIFGEEVLSENLQSEIDYCQRIINIAG